MGKKYCWEKYTYFGKNHRCTLEPGHEGPHRYKSWVYTHFGKGACDLCGGTNVTIESNYDECKDCGNRMVEGG
jgi:hypothetical protein